MEQTMKQRNIAYLAFFEKFYPWFSGLSGDLLFYIAIDTLFLTVVKGLPAAQIVFITTISSIICILLQKPLITLIQKIGNKKSIQLGAIFALISIVMITFSNSYFIILVASAIRETSNVLKNMQGVLLLNNLKYEEQEDKYIQIKNKSNIVYALVTAMIAFVTGFMFEINPYLPMYCSIATCAICVVMSFFIKEMPMINKEQKKEVEKQGEIQQSALILINIFSYSIFFAAIIVGQQNAQLFIQYELTKVYSMVLTANYLGIIISISRIARIATNVIFNNMYEKYKDKVSIILTFGLVLSFICLLVGYFINGILALKFTIMSIGFCLILGIRDPFKIYLENKVLTYTTPQNQQKVFTYLELGKKIGVVGISLLASLVLTKFELVYIILGLFALALIEFFVNFALYKVIIEKQK